MSDDLISSEDAKTRSASCCDCLGILCSNLSDICIVLTIVEVLLAGRPQELDMALLL